MALKTFNPTTPGQRQLVMVDRSALYKGKPVKALTEGKLGTGGRKAAAARRSLERLDAVEKQEPPHPRPYPTIRKTDARTR